MALNRRIENFRITVNSTNYDLSINNMTVSDQLETFTDAVTSVGGRRYIRPAGVRKRIEIEYDANYDAADWRQLINDIITHLVTNGNQFFDLYLDATKTTASDKLEVQPENLEYIVQYSNQISTLIPKLTLIQRDRQTSIPTDFEAP